MYECNNLHLKLSLILSSIECNAFMDVMLNALLLHLLLEMFFSY